MTDHRRKVSSAKLHELLEREFSATAAGLCGGCRVPRPLFMESREGGANWRLPALGECPSLCHTILQDVAAKLAREYDVAEGAALARGPTGSDSKRDARGQVRWK